MRRRKGPAPRTPVWLAVLVTAGILAAAGAAPRLSLQQTVAAGRGAAARLARAGTAWRPHGNHASPSSIVPPARVPGGRPVSARVSGITVTTARSVPGTGPIAAWVARVRVMVVGAAESVRATVVGAAESARAAIAPHLPGGFGTLAATVGAGALALLGFIVVHARGRSRRRSAARLLRRGASHARVGRETRLAQDAVRFIGQSERA